VEPDSDGAPKATDRDWMWRRKRQSRKPIITAAADPAPSAGGLRLAPAADRRVRLFENHRVLGDVGDCVLAGESLELFFEGALHRFLGIIRKLFAIQPRTISSLSVTFMLMTDPSSVQPPVTVNRMAMVSSSSGFQNRTHR